MGQRQYECGLARETIKCGSDGSAHRDVVTTELWYQISLTFICIHIPVYVLAYKIHNVPGLHNECRITHIHTHNVIKTT